MADNTTDARPVPSYPISSTCKPNSSGGKLKNELTIVCDAYQRLSSFNKVLCLLYTCKSYNTVVMVTLTKH